MPRLPATPELEPAENEDEEEDRIRAVELERHEPAQAERPDRGMQRRHGAAAVQRDDRQEVEEVDQEADERHRLEEVRVVHGAQAPDRNGAYGPEHRAG